MEKKMYVKGRSTKDGLNWLGSFPPCIIIIHHPLFSSTNPSFSSTIRHYRAPILIIIPPCQSAIPYHAQTRLINPLRRIAVQCVGFKRKTKTHAP